MFDEMLQPGMKEPSTSLTVKTPLAAKTTATEQPWLVDDAVRSSQPKLENQALIVLPLGLIAICAIALLGCRQQQKRRENSGLRHNQPTSLHHHIPCQHCIFFKDSPYLKCAIHPIDALTQRAIDCADYAPNIPPSGKKARSETVDR